MRIVRHLLPAFLFAGLGFVPLQARLGETMAEIQKEFGKPEGQPRKDNAYWLFEGDDGLLNYTVTFNAAGRSIAEGLKPVRRARFTESNALVFIESQLTPWEGSKTMRILKPGEKYRFASQDFVCGPDEHVVLDEPHGVLLIWTKTVSPAVMIVSPEMFQRVK
jgi:hypothetical protein